MMTDTISDLLIRIKNGYMARKANIVSDHSKMREGLVRLLSKEGYLGKIQVKSDGKVKKNLLIDLVYVGKEPKLTEVVRMSKISRRIYAKSGKAPKVLGGLGISVLSTSMGLMTDKEARKKGIGGEVICKIW